MFRPPRCPNSSCPMFQEPVERFYKRAGTFHPKCRPNPVQRFRCYTCGRTFSIRTFKPDYYDKKPHLNVLVVRSLCSGTGLRQTSRELDIRYTSLCHKVDKLNRQLAHLHANLMGQFGVRSEFLFDELETFETCRSTSPLTVPILIERESMLIVDAQVGKIPPSGSMPPNRRRRLAALEKEHGKRPNESSQVIASVLDTLAPRVRKSRELVFTTDQKTTYPGLIERAFPNQTVHHRTVSSKVKRDSRNELHRINLTNALARDRVARLRRRTWCVSKRGDRLQAQLAMWVAYRNYHRNRFNRDRSLTPAMLCGFVPRPLSKQEMLAWRQDWGPDYSIHPLARRGESVTELKAA